MTNEELKLRIGNNIARLRKEAGMTQAELAERLNYSDKAVSKWERGESMPDILTLMQMSQHFGKDINELLYEPQEHADTPAPEEKAAPAKPSKKQPRRRVADKNVIMKLSCLLVWIVALFIYLVLDSFGIQHSWLIFVVGILANAIVLLVLRSVWKMYGINRILISVIMWTTLVFFYLVVWFIWAVSIWRIFLLGVLGQIAIVLWFKLFQYPEDENE